MEEDRESPLQRKGVLKLLLPLFTLWVLCVTSAVVTFRLGDVRESLEAKRHGYKSYSRYKGRECKVDSDDNCLSDPCGSHGTCVGLSHSYHCICDVGYTGYNCHLSICEEDSSPCENNSTCSLCEEGVCNSTGLSFQCECVEGFHGVLCTDRDAAWLDWSELPTTTFQAYQSSYIEASLLVALCTKSNKTRERQCNTSIKMGAGTSCTGQYEESVILASVCDCSCVTCCSGHEPCAILLDRLCYCNQHCGTSPTFDCCNNQTLWCSKMTIT